MDAADILDNNQPEQEDIHDGSDSLVQDEAQEMRKSQEIVDVSSDEEEENINDIDEDNDKEENDSVTLEQEPIDNASEG